jgi:signal transduction histidine kinase
VREFDVSLQGTAEALQLEVRDAGAGFDLDQAKQSTGLGLVSMQERIHALHGQLRIESKPGAGTTVLVSVPLTATNVSDPGHVKNWRLAG